MQWLADDDIKHIEFSENKKEQIIHQLCQEAIQNAGIRQTAPYFGGNQKVDITLEVIKENPYWDRIALVRQNNRLCEDERKYLLARAPIVGEALGRLRIQIPEGSRRVPTIAVATSGGGVRAMLTTLGFLEGLERAGLLDTVMYISTLSGSTWAVAPWISWGLNNQTPLQSIIKIKEQLIDPLSVGLTGWKQYLPLVYANDLYTILQRGTSVKRAFRQPVNTIDGYGALLANRFLRIFEPDQAVADIRHRKHLSDQFTNIRDGKLPFPIYTAVSADKDQPERRWYEFTPCEIGGAWLGHYVPTWAFGREFNCNRSQDQAPEQSLGFLMGIFGSAFAAPLGQWYEMLPENIKGIFAGIRDRSPQFVLDRFEGADQVNIFASRVHNFTLNSPNGPIRGQHYMDMSDGGVDFNLPYPPISGQRPERMADIIVFLDASAADPQADEFRKVITWASSKGIPLPVQQPLPDLKNQSYTVFPSPAGSNAPTVIYMPLYKDQDLIKDFESVQQDITDISITQGEFDALLRDVNYHDNYFSNPLDRGVYSTFNFQYKQDQARRLCSLLTFNVIANRQNIIQAIQTWIQGHTQQLQEPPAYAMPSVPEELPPHVHVIPAEQVQPPHLQWSDLDQQRFQMAQQIMTRARDDLGNARLTFNAMVRGRTLSSDAERELRTSLNELQKEIEEFEQYLNNVRQMNLLPEDFDYQISTANRRFQHLISRLPVEPIRRPR